MPSTWKSQLERIMNDLRDRGFVFASGGALGVDLWCLDHLVNNNLSNSGTIYSAWTDISGFPKKVQPLIDKFQTDNGTVVWGAARNGDPRGKVTRALLNRNKLLLKNVAGIVALYDSKSRGTIFTIKESAKQWKPIVAFPHQAELPSIGNSRWHAFMREDAWKGGYKSILG